MSFFNFLFGSKLSLESLAKLENDEEIKLKLKKSKVKDLQKLCLTKCQDLDTEDKQKDVYINAILDVIHKMKSSTAPVAPALPAAVSQELESHPVDLEHPPAPVEAEPLHLGEAAEQKPPSGGKMRRKSKGGRKRGRKLTHRRK
jgi:hypothetical protein